MVNIYFSDFFNVDPSFLEDYGAFNISLINDLPLFIDPFLLFNSKKKEYQDLHLSIIEYVTFLREKSYRHVIQPGLLSNLFSFHEIKQNWLGYSKIGNKGSGLGLEFAKALNKNLNYIFKDFGEETVTRSSHLEKLCLIESGIGKDSISDFTTNLIKEYLLEYTQQFAIKHIEPIHLSKFRIDKVNFNYETESWVSDEFILPMFENDFVILTPRDILTKDQNWINKQDIINDFYLISNSIPNEELRSLLNNYLQKNLPINHKKKDFVKAVDLTIKHFPEFIDYYIRYKENKGDEAESVSKEKVKNVEQIFIEKVKNFVSKFLDKSEFYSMETANTYVESKRRLMFFKDAIENKGGHKFFYDKGQPIRREVDLHLLFRLVWYGTKSDVSREVNDGRGPVDYKITKGAYDKNLIEFKLASNSRLKANLEKQVEIYKKASDSDKAIKVIVYFTEPELNKVHRILEELGLTQSEDIILIDARSDNKPSGSKA